MNHSPQVESQPSAPVPPDDPGRHLTHASPDVDASLPHLGVVGDTYTILVSGRDTAGHYTLIDMHVPPGGGPPLTATTSRRCSPSLTVRSSSPSAASPPSRRRATPSTCLRTRRMSSRNNASRPARLLCLCSPAGQEEFFRAVGVPVATRTEAPPPSTQQAPRASSPKPWRSRRDTNQLLLPAQKP